MERKRYDGGESVSTIKEKEVPVWRTRPLEEQGGVTLEAWKILELPNGDRHLVGYSVENDEGRVSSAVRHFDPSSLRAQTGSGRAYKLSGQPGANQDADYVWARWADVNAANSWTDVTEMTWREHLALRPAR